MVGTNQNIFQTMGLRLRFPEMFNISKLKKLYRKAVWEILKEWNDNCRLWWIITYIVDEWNVAEA